MKKLVIARIAVDEFILKYNGRKCYLFAALDVERNKIIHLRVYPARNALTAYSFLKEVLKMCEVEEIILDKGPWYALNRLLNSGMKALEKGVWLNLSFLLLSRSKDFLLFHNG